MYRGYQYATEIKAIRTEADYRAALEHVSALIDIDPGPDTPEGERLDALGTLVQAWEAKHYPIGPPESETVATCGSAAMRLTPR